MQIRSAVAAFASAIVLASSGAYAASFAEIGDATGALPGQAAVGVGSLDSITGAIGFNNDADVFRITITDAASFSARTVGGIPDTQLFLFELSGVGIAANDDCGTFPFCGTRSRLDAGDPLYNSLLAGEYLIAISEYDLDPVDAGNAQIFPDTPFNAIVGPNGGVGTLAGWAQGGLPSTGSYTIELSGAGFANAIPEPSAALLYLAGFAVVGGQLLRSGRRNRRA